MRILSCGLIIALAAGLAGAGEWCRSGNFIVETDAKTGTSIIDLNSTGPIPPAFLDDTLEQLGNPGFETGSLPPWYSSMWVATDIDSHAGHYCATDVGNYYIQQDLTPVMTDSIVSITFWSRQPDAEIQAFDLLYSDNTYYETIVWVPVTWQRFDVTSYLTMGKYLVSFRLWGFVGGGPEIDSTYSDDVSILKWTAGHKVEEVLPATPRTDIRIRPNPVRDKAVIECPGARDQRPTLSIYDLSGAVVERGILNDGRYVWSTEGRVSGVYFIRIDAGNGRAATKEVLVVK